MVPIRRRVQAVRAAVRHLHGVAALGKALPEILRRLRLVLDNQNLHCLTISGKRKAIASAS